MTWILTQSGTRFDLLNPTPDMINIPDIAYALSRICRFNGHTSEHYSVAEHSLRVAALVPREYQLAALLHDAAEAYIGDVSSPLKALLPEYLEIEQRIWSAICQRFAIAEQLPECVKRADLIMLATERRDLMPYHSDQWECLKGVNPEVASIGPMPSRVAESAFLDQLSREADRRARMKAYGVPKNINEARKLANQLADLIADDSYAASFQSMGSYRAALLKALATPPALCNHPKRVRESEHEN